MEEKLREGMGAREDCAAGVALAQGMMGASARHCEGIGGLRMKIVEAQIFSQ